VTQPCIKWAGGKRQLLPEIRKHVPKKFGRYFEPFIGGGALFFDLEPCGATLCDQNERLVRTYIGVRDDVEGVIRLLSTYPYKKSFYMKTRALSTTRMSGAEQAAWFLYLNRAGFNGLYRVNKKNEFNVPFGRYENPTICDAERLRECSKALGSAVIAKCDFQKMLDGARKGDFVYFDPPYVPLSATSNFTSYTDKGFGPADQVRLRDVALSLKKRGVHVLLSHSSAPMVRDLYASGFQIFPVTATRAINSKTEKRGAIAELLIK